MCVQKFYFIILMDRNTVHRFNDAQDEINSILDENIEIAENTKINLQNQGNQIDNINQRMINIEYITEKGKDIINRMSSFFHRFRTTQLNFNPRVTSEPIQMESLNSSDLFVQNDSTLARLDRLKKIGLKIGEVLDDQNIKLDRMDIDIDRNKSYINKNIEKIDKILS